MKRAWIALVLVAGACATYDERMVPVHQAYYGGRPAEAVALLEAELENADDEDVGLLRLELASALQAADRHLEAAQALSSVDDELEVLDYTTNSANDVGAFLMSGELRTWKASPPERLMLNTQAMINYLVLGDLEGAQVEARRARVLLSQADVADEDRYPNDFVNALGGLCMDLGSNAAEATDFWSALDANPLRAAPGGVPEGHGSVIVVTQLGKSPIRREAAFVIFVQGMPHQLRVPMLLDRPSRFREASVLVDGAPQGRVEPLFDLGTHMLRRFEQELPVLLAAAATQAVLRGAVSKAVQSSAGGSSDDESDAFVGWLAGVATNVAMAEMQSADTRCWNLTPRILAARRVDLPAGKHRVTVELSGDLLRTLEHEVDVPAGGFVLLNVVSDLHGGWQALQSPRDTDANDMPAAMQALAILEAAALAVEIVN